VEGAFNHFELPSTIFYYHSWIDLPICKIMRNMLILTGPQGSGNHLWSKILSLHPKVYGWKSLLDNYWEAHRFSEPFCECWKNPSKLSEFNWKQSQFYFTSISVPLGIKEKKWAPNILEFKQAAEDCGVNVQIAVIGRDQNILYNQQSRLRGEHTLLEFMEQLNSIPDATYLSYELLYLYKEKYLQSLHLNIPICYYSDQVSKILEKDANEKYVHYVDENLLDNCNKTGVGITEAPK
jgi:hypothetical protein